MRQNICVTRESPECCDEVMYMHFYATAALFANVGEFSRVADPHERGRFADFVQLGMWLTPQTMALAA